VNLKSVVYRYGFALLVTFGGITPLLSRADSPRVKEKNLIAIEVLGRGGYGSIQYDRVLYPRLSIGAGVGAVTATTYAVARSLTSVSSIRVEPWYFIYSNYYLTGEYLSPFLTAGVTHLSGNSRLDFTFWPGAGIEFRTHVGPTLRLTFYLPKVSPIGTVPGYPGIWSGLLLGYCF
jgi:hypothetical protein